MSYYDDGYLLGKAHARPDSNLDPRHTLAYVAREGGKAALAEFMRGFDDGYAGNEPQEEVTQ